MSFCSFSAKQALQHRNVPTLSCVFFRIYDVGALCHFTTFLGHLSNFLIPWYTLCLAVDLFVKLYHSSSAVKICSSLKAKVRIQFYTYYNNREVASQWSYRFTLTYLQLFCHKMGVATSWGHFSQQKCKPTTNETFYLTAKVISNFAI